MCFTINCFQNSLEHFTKSPFFSWSEAGLRSPTPKSYGLISSLPWNILPEAPDYSQQLQCRANFFGPRITVWTISCLICSKACCCSESHYKLFFFQVNWERGEYSTALKKAFLLHNGDIASIFLIKSICIWQNPSCHLGPKNWISRADPLAILCFTSNKISEGFWQFSSDSQKLLLLYYHQCAVGIQELPPVKSGAAHGRFYDSFSTPGIVDSTGHTSKWKQILAYILPPKRLRKTYWQYHLWHITWLNVTSVCIEVHRIIE